MRANIIGTHVSHMTEGGGAIIGESVIKSIMQSITKSIDHAIDRSRNRSWNREEDGPSRCLMPGCGSVVRPSPGRVSRRLERSRCQNPLQYWSAPRAAAGHTSIGNHPSPLPTVCYFPLERKCNSVASPLLPRTLTVLFSVFLCFCFLFFLFFWFLFYF